MAHRLTEAERTDLVATYLAGGNVYAWSRAHGVAPTNVYPLLRRRGLKAQRLPTQRKHEFDRRFFVRRDAQVAYWAGFLAADGGITQDRTVRVQVHVKDEPHLRALSAALGSSIVPQAIPGRHLVRIMFHGVQMVEDLAWWGVIPRKTYLDPPPPPITAPELIRSFIRGYIDGDGWIGSKTVRGLRQLQWGLQIVGQAVLLRWIKESLTEEVGSGGGLYPVQGAVKLGYAGNRQVTAILRWLYRSGDVALARKAALAARCMELA